MLGGISIWQLLIILAIVIMIFGTKKLKTLGGDLGSAVKGFKSAMKEGEQEAAKEETVATNNLEKNAPIDVEATQVTTQEQPEKERS